MSSDSIWNNFVDVVILPPPEVRDYAIELSAKLHEYGTPWKLGLEERRPHLSLFHFPIWPAPMSRRIVAKHLSLEIRGGNLQLWDISSPRHGAIFLDTNRPDWLVEAAEQTSSMLRASGLAIEDERFMERWRQMELSPRMEENIRRWGSPLMGEDFLPHFTLGAMNDKTKVEEAVYSLPCRKMSWHVDRLFIVQVTDGWTAGEVLAEAVFDQKI